MKLSIPLLITYLMLCSCSTFATVIEPMCFNNYSSECSQFNVKRSLSNWPAIEPLSTKQEVDIYNSLWNSNLTLTNNIEQLFNIFLKTCFDFSFHIIPSAIKGVLLGESETTKTMNKPFNTTKLIFSNVDESKFDNSYRKHSFYQMKDDTNENMSDIVFENITPVNFEFDTKYLIQKHLHELVTDSAGCEIIRILTTKYIANPDMFTKIILVPIAAPTNIHVTFTSGEYIWQRLQNDLQKKSNIFNPINFDKYETNSIEHKFLLFSLNWLHSEFNGFTTKILKKYDQEFFQISMEPLPKEIVFLHELIYASIPNKKYLYRSTSLIEQRISDELFAIDHPATKEFLITKKQYISLTTHDNLVYQIMYGLTQNGISTICESMYSAHKYKFIRPTYIGPEISLKINDKYYNQKTSRSILKCILCTYGDLDLYSYYLSEDSTLKYPKFGEGNYRVKQTKIQNFVKNKYKVKQPKIQNIVYYKQNYLNY